MPLYARALVSFSRVNSNQLRPNQATFGSSFILEVFPTRRISAHGPDESLPSARDHRLSFHQYADPCTIMSSLTTGPRRRCMKTHSLSVIVPTVLAIDLRPEYLNSQSISVWAKPPTSTITTAFIHHPNHCPNLLLK